MPSMYPLKEINLPLEKTVDFLSFSCMLFSLISPWAVYRTGRRDTVLFSLWRFIVDKEVTTIVQYSSRTLSIVVPVILSILISMILNYILSGFNENTKVSNIKITQGLLFIFMGFSLSYFYYFRLYMMRMYYTVIYFSPSYGILFMFFSVVLNVLKTILLKGDDYVNILIEVEKIDD